MSLILRVLSGARTGHEQVLEKSIIVAGRHPMCDLRFDPERDRDVSTRHAEIRAVGDSWMVRDLGSTNGTFVNGERIATERVLSVRDVLSFGEFGPRVEVAALTPHIATPTESRSPAQQAPVQQVPAQQMPPQVPASPVAAGAAAPAQGFVVPPLSPPQDPAASYRVRKTQPSGERPAKAGARAVADAVRGE